MSDLPASDSTRRPVHVDSDGGVDDIAGLWYLLGSVDAELVGITVTPGNVGVDVAADNLSRVCQLAGVDLPISLGQPTTGAHPPVRPADFIHGTDGVGDTGRRPEPWEPDERGADELLADMVVAHPDELLLIALGPLTNIARFVDRRPDLVPLVGRLVVMGGAVAVQGNALPNAEANIAHDPEAAAVVATAPWARPPLIVPLDVTLAATLTETEFELLAEHRTAAAVDLDAPLAFYRVFGATFNAPGECPCHDLTTVAVALEPSLVTAPVLPFGVDTSGGLAWGTTVVDRRRPFFARAGAAAEQALPPGLADWHVALSVDVDAVRLRYRSLFGEPASGGPAETRTEETTT